MLQERKRVRDANEVPTIVTLEDVSVTFRADLSLVDVASTRLDCDYYRRQEGGGIVAERADAINGADLDSLFKKRLLRTEGGDAGGFME